MSKRRFVIRASVCVLAGTAIVTAHSAFDWPGRRLESLVVKGFAQVIVPIDDNDPFDLDRVAVAYQLTTQPIDFGRMFKRAEAAAVTSVAIRVLTGAAISMLLLYLWMGMRIRISESKTLCRSCGYILSGLADVRCPECGTTM